MASVYILFSRGLNSFYTGSCFDFKTRFQQHLSGVYGNAYTKRASDWIVFLLIENLEYDQARGIENHIKLMKSRKYIENLKKYPEMVSSLISGYGGAGSSR